MWLSSGWAQAQLARDESEQERQRALTQKQTRRRWFECPSSLLEQLQCRIALEALGERRGERPRRPAPLGRAPRRELDVLKGPRAVRLLIHRNFPHELAREHFDSVVGALGRGGHEGPIMDVVTPPRTKRPYIASWLIFLS